MKTFLLIIISSILLVPVITISQLYEIPEQFTTEELSKMSLQELMNLTIITASKKEEKIKDVAASVVVITKSDIETYGYKNTLEVLENIPGVFLNNSYLSENIGIRGFLSENTTAIFVNSVYHNTYVSFIPVQSIDRIEVVRGPISIVYGSGAFLGAINIITNEKKNENDYSHSISSAIGSMNSYDIFGKFTHSGNNYSTSINIGIYKTDGLDVPYDELIRNPKRLPILGIPENKTTNNQLGEDRLYCNMNAKFGDFTFDFTYIEDKRGIIYFYPSTDEGSDIKKNVNYISISYNKEIKNNLVLNAKVDFSKKTRSYDFNFDLSDTNLGGPENAYFSEEYKESRVIPEINLFWNINEKIQLNFGLYSRIELEGTDKPDIPFWGSYLTNSDLYFVNEDENVYTNAIYSQFQYKPLENLFFKFGLRAEEMLSFNVHHDISQGTDNPDTFDDTYLGSGINILPQFAIIYEITDNQLIKLLYGSSIRNPEIKDIYSDLWTLHKSSLKKNPLKAEKITTYELNYTIGLFDSKLLPSISFYRNHYTDMIQKQQMYHKEKDEYYWLYQNYACLLTNGVEFNLIHTPYKYLKFEFSLSYQETVNEDYEDMPVGNSPAILGYIKAQYLFDNMSFGLTANYVDKMYSNWNIINEQRDADEVPAYFNLGLNFRINDIYETGIFTNLRLSNILDQEIRYAANSQEFSQRGYIAAGRTFQLTIGYNFD